MDTLMPAIFFGHGNPINALQRNSYTEAWADIGKAVPRPKAIVVISAHWYLPGTAITANLQPPTIHDFGGFPQALYDVEYQAPGDPPLAKHIQDMLAPLTVNLDENWGLDHGAWSVLCHAFPEADIPVVQLSIDASKPPQFHYELGKQLAALRSEGILLMGSGNIVHNLRTYAWGKTEVTAYDWADRFENQIRKFIFEGDHESLINYMQLGTDAALAVPTPEHYLPLLYVLGSKQAGEEISLPVEGMEGGSISMLSVQIG
ncbi:MAG TPA: 4,5-DOPA dioxygenase extradiol [Methylophilaceae bacterium]|jgi:4,5-DOPA dioxygenase extradiol